MSVPFLFFSSYFHSNLKILDESVNEKHFIPVRKREILSLVILFLLFYIDMI